MIKFLVSFVIGLSLLALLIAAVYRLHYPWNAAAFFGVPALVLCFVGWLLPKLVTIPQRYVIDAKITGGILVFCTFVMTMVGIWG